MKLFGDTIDYVAVFDSDFQPSPSFLRDLTPYLVANPTVGWVQVGAAWVLVSAHPQIPHGMTPSSRDPLSAEMITLLLAAEPLDLHEPR
jgi:cellulose synthase/poly-beta-1,6-N-acetylglucosamine synthase-like glycosyltransferase